MGMAETTTDRTDQKTPCREQDREPIPLRILEQAAETLKAVAHPVRLRIVDLLGRHGEMNVSELVEALDAKPAITSQQLGLMKDRGIAVCRREGNKVYYRLANPNLMRVLDCIREHCAKSGR